MDAFLTSTLLVALAEIGDKTQLLSFVLAARLRRPWAIVAGIFVATLLSPNVLRWSVGILFIAFGLWTLKPDTLDDDDTPTSHGGAFVTTLIAFFIAEMGDKTQFATVALAARFDALAAVVTGTTVGMLLANVPAVLIGEKLAKKLPLDWIRRLAALVFILTGGATLLTTGA
jgi:putative Ca2+/H+ antiporter (TMEM165/GDT1 family)